MEITRSYHNVYLTPFGRGSAIDQDTFSSFIPMQNEFLHHVHHVDIHGLADIDIERHVDNDMDNGEYISK
jgi:hypothetical protein